MTRTTKLVLRNLASIYKVRYLEGEMFLMKNKVIHLDMRISHFNKIFKINTQHLADHLINALMMPTSTAFNLFSTNYDMLNMEEGQTMTSL